MQAAASDVFEIESSKLAMQKGDEAVKKFATQMISDHEKTTAELTALLYPVRATSWCGSVAQWTGERLGHRDTIALRAKGCRSMIG